MLHPRNGFIPPGGRCTIEVRCVAPQPGAQKYIVVVRNLSSASGTQDTELPIRTHGVHPNYLAFPDLVTSAPSPSSSSSSSSAAAASTAAAAAGATTAADAGSKTVEGELAFGLCHIFQPSHSGSARAAEHASHVRPLRITNLQAMPHQLSATPNLKLQAAIFLDDGCTEPATGPIALGAHQTTTLWVSLRPQLSADVLSGAVCRQLVGTIRVSLHTADGALIEEKPVRFTATFGRSKLRVAPRAIRFGRLRAPPLPPPLPPPSSGVVGVVPPPEVARASVRVANLSEQMPLHYVARRRAASRSNPRPACSRPRAAAVPSSGGATAVSSSSAAVLSAPPPPPRAPQQEAEAVAEPPPASARRPRRSRHWRRVVVAAAVAATWSRGSARAGATSRWRCGTRCTASTGASSTWPTPTSPGRHSRSPSRRSLRRGSSRCVACR